MIRRLSITAMLLAGLAAAPAFAAGDAAAGAQHLKELNLIVLGNADMTSEVEGKAFITGNFSGAGNIGAGSIANPTQSQATTGGFATLFVGGSLSMANIEDIKVKNGANGAGLLSNGSSVIVRNNSGPVGLPDSIRSIVVGGDYIGGSNSPLNTVMVGGDLKNGNISGVSGGTIQIGGNLVSANVNANGATYTQPVPGLQGLIQSAADTAITTVTDNILALSDTLKNLTVINPSSFVIAGSDLTLNAVDGGQGFALFNLNVADLVGKQSLFVNADLSKPVIVNVAGSTDLNWDMAIGSGNAAALNGSIIWNFVDGPTLTINDEFHGSILAPYSTVSALSQINGTVVAGTFHGNAEVHLGTYNKITTFNSPPPAVPEPASWALMIGGLGLVGGMMRRRAQDATIRHA